MRAVSFEFFNSISTFCSDCAYFVDSNQFLPIVLRHVNVPINEIVIRWVKKYDFFNGFNLTKNLNFKINFSTQPFYYAGVDEIHETLHLCWFES